MGLTEAERAKRYRAKRKEDKGRNEAYKIKQKMRNQKRKKVAVMTAKEHRAIKSSWRKWDQNRRIREKALASVSNTSPVSASESSGNISMEEKVLLTNYSKINERNKKLELKVQILKNKEIELRRRLASKTNQCKSLQQKLKDKALEIRNKISSSNVKDEKLENLSSVSEESSLNH
ncbi:unnamed protein product [Nezara viridula]|uniref:Uncharacterized protein n=1 Tax=Nezara viridula TaxID=85310 RepID=A0A9P0H8J7_NEZVI|nr:unnamed protein product [Nezara viridula]